MPSDILPYITGIENVHCELSNHLVAREFYAKLFGPPAHTDGDWSEFKPAGFDFAVTSGIHDKFVITFKVVHLEELRARLLELFTIDLETKHGDYGRYLELCPGEGFCIHFFEALPRGDSE